MKIQVELTPRQVKRIEFILNTFDDEFYKYNKNSKRISGRMKLAGIKAVITDAINNHYKEMLKLVNMSEDHENKPLTPEI